MIQERICLIVGLKQFLDPASERGISAARFLQECGSLGNGGLFRGRQEQLLDSTGRNRHAPPGFDGMVPQTDIVQCDLLATIVSEDSQIATTMEILRCPRSHSVATLGRRSTGDKPLRARCRVRPRLVGWTAQQRSGVGRPGQPPHRRPGAG